VIVWDGGGCCVYYKLRVGVMVEHLRFKFGNERVHCMECE
jgi:hypothetical protein